MHDAEECRPRHAARDAADHASFQIDHKRITEALVHERNALIIGRDVRPLSKVRQYLDVFGEVVEWIAVLSLSKHWKREYRERNYGIEH